MINQESIEMALLTPSDAEQIIQEYTLTKGGLFVGGTEWFEVIDFLCGRLES